MNKEFAVVAKVKKAIAMRINKNMLVFYIGINI
jgi:hypothetical protein